MNKFIYAIMTVMVGGVLGIGVLEDKDNENFKTQATQEYYDNIENVVVSNKRLNKNENNVIGNINIPVITSKTNHDKSKDISKIFENDAIEFYENVKENNKYYKNYKVDIDYEIMRNNKNILSVYTMYNKYDDNSTEYQNDVAYNIDLRTGQILNLKDLFVDNYNYENVINREIKKIIDNNKENNEYKSFKKIDSNQIYYLKDDKLVIYFEPGKIAENGVGSPRFEIPVNSFGENFKHEYILN